MSATVQHGVIERRGVDLLASLRAYRRSNHSSNIRRIAAYTVGSNADKDLLVAVVTALRRLANDPESRIVWADHPTDSRYDGTETESPKRLQLRRGR